MQNHCGVKHLIFLALSILLGIAMAQAELRTFTSVNGRKVEGEIVKIEDGTAFVKLVNGSPAKIPLDSLAANDRAEVTKWWEENKDKLGPMDVRLAIDRKSDRLERKVERPKQAAGRNNQQSNQPTKKLTVDEFHYVCTLKNYTPRDLTNITAEYIIYKRTTGRDKTGSINTTKEIRAEKAIAFLEASGTTSFETEKVKCEDKSENTGGGGKGAGKVQMVWQRESIMGIVVILRAGDKEILRQSDPDGFLARLRQEEQRENSRE